MLDDLHHKLFEQVTEVSEAVGDIYICVPSKCSMLNMQGIIVQWVKKIQFLSALQCCTIESIITM